MVIGWPLVRHFQPADGRHRAAGWALGGASYGPQTSYETVLQFSVMKF
jgi:hypothetical protein